MPSCSKSDAGIFSYHRACRSTAITPRLDFSLNLAPGPTSYVGTRLGRFAIHGRGLQANMMPKMTTFLLSTIKQGQPVCHIQSNVVVNNPQIIPCDLVSVDIYRTRSE